MIRLGESGFSKSMVKEFASAQHFETYKGESNSSFSANCNALLALLSDNGNLSETGIEAVKLTRFVSDQCWHNHQPPRDKWVRPLPCLPANLCSTRLTIAVARTYLHIIA